MTRLGALTVRLDGQVALVTGGYGVLGGSIAAGLAAAGARVAVLGRRRQEAERKADALREAGGEAIGVVADVLEARQVAAARDTVLGAWGRLDILINGAGGNVAGARNDDRSIFSVPQEAFDEVLRLNLQGTVTPSLAIAEQMTRQGSGSIINFSSMAATRVISGVLGYTVAKAGIDSFTRWLAVELARKHSAGVRVNAVAPGFFITRQNQSVLLDTAGGYTERARRIIAQTPMGRFGRPDELVGVVLWLCSDAASFVTGAVIPVDGGFSLFSGV